MDFYTYFETCESNFWHWEDQARVIAMPEGGTIAYREFALQILENLREQGVPTFGALLMAIAATNSNAETSIQYLRNFTDKLIVEPFGDNPDFKNTLEFLTKLSELPSKYKKADKYRIDLLQSIFTNCHNMISVKDARKIVRQLKNETFSDTKIAEKVPFNREIVKKDFQILALLNRKFKDADAIVNSITNLPQLEDDLLLEKNEESGGSRAKDFVEELMENQATFPIGSLLRHLWSGLNIPFHNTLPSKQPLGGVSDLTNKGDFDKLLISEFANDDLIFMSRLANNEALYINREIPPTKSTVERVLLIDVSIKNWGSARMLAYSVAVAISKHPKTDISYKSFAVGRTCNEISFDSIDSIIDGLKHLDSDLHAAKGLEFFLKENSKNSNLEVFFITSPDAFKAEPLQKVISEYNGAFKYWILADAQGEINLYLNRQKSRNLIQTIKLPLEKLWSNPPKTAPKERKAMETDGMVYPIRFPFQQSNYTLYTSDEMVFKITKDGKVFKNERGAAQYNIKGWELVCEGLTHPFDKAAIGKASDGNYVLLTFFSQDKSIEIFRLGNGEKKLLAKGHFTIHDIRFYAEFIFLEDCFYVLKGLEYWQINFQKGLKINHFQSRTQEFDDLYAKRVIPPVPTKAMEVQANFFKNPSKININAINRLTFDKHELSLTPQENIKMMFKRESLSNRAEAQKDVSGFKFVFHEGSTIFVNPSGMMVLISSDSSIPPIFIPTALEQYLGVATANEFAGIEYYRKETGSRLELESAGERKLHSIKILREFTGLGLRDLKLFIDGEVKHLHIPLAQAKTRELQKSLAEEGTIISVKSSGTGQETISCAKFYAQYIEVFINHIITTQNGI